MNYLILDPKYIQNNTHSDVYTIDNDEQVRHITTVLKSKEGDSLKVAILGGNLGTAQIANMTNNSIYLEKIEALNPPPPKLPVTLVLCLPRPKALRRIIMDAVAMGIESIYLVNSYRVEKSYWQSPHLPKLTDYALQGLAQAGDSIMPEIYLRKRFKPFVEDELPEIIANKIALLAHPYAKNTLNATLDIDTMDKKQLAPLVVVIGAEGGFIPYEVDMLTNQGCYPVKIFDRVLRTETAISLIMGNILSKMSTM